MAQNKQDAVRRAKADLAKRLKVSETDIKEVSTAETDFPDSSLGTAVNEEMSAQMITSGWRIKLSAAGKNYEYRADGDQLRLSNFNGNNYIIQ